MNIKEQKVFLRDFIKEDIEDRIKISTLVLNGISLGAYCHSEPQAKNLWV